MGNEGIKIETAEAVQNDAERELENLRGAHEKISEATHDICLKLDAELTGIKIDADSLYTGADARKV